MFNFFETTQDEIDSDAEPQPGSSFGEESQHGHPSLELSVSSEGTKRSKTVIGIRNRGAYFGCKKTN